MGEGEAPPPPPPPLKFSPDPAHTPCTSSVPCTLLTPVAPHSLSFRPLVLPEACDLALHLPADARSAARASFDGRGACRLPAGAWVRATTSACALPVVTGGALDADW